MWPFLQRAAGFFAIQEADGSMTTYQMTAVKSSRTSLVTRVWIPIPINKKTAMITILVV